MRNLLAHLRDAHKRPNAPTCGESPYANECANTTMPIKRRSNAQSQTHKHWWRRAPFDWRFSRTWRRAFRSVSPASLSSRAGHAVCTIVSLCVYVFCEDISFPCCVCDTHQPLVRAGLSWECFSPQLEEQVPGRRMAHRRRGMWSSGQLTLRHSRGGGNIPTTNRP